ncbi:MAG: outer membrane beta-barrel protein [Gammaproteobacteria bacterium]|nr:outer membrane beta-barrel protein [Gammaproteobacteria bacterium]
MRTRLVAQSVALTLALGMATAAAAQMTPWYGGVGVNFNGASGYNGTTGFTVFGGYRLPYRIATRGRFAVELGYDHYGTFDVSGTGGAAYASAHDIEASAVFTWPLVQHLSVFGRAGLADSSATYTVNIYPGPYYRASASSVHLVVGAGVNYQILPQVGVRAEYRHTGMPSVMGSSINSFSIAGTFRF